MCKFEVERFDFVHAFTSAESPIYDVLITVVGYEARGRYLVEKVQDGRFSHILAYQYSHNRVASYEANRALYTSLNATVIDVPEDQFYSDLARRLAELVVEMATQVDRPFRVAVDISCMDRDRLGRTVRCILAIEGVSVEVVFAYSVGGYDNLLIGSEGQVRVNRAIAGFQGWTDDPTLPVVAIIGCGVESRLALAAVETLEPSEVLWLVPEGEDPAYDALIAGRNAALFQDSRTEPYFYPVIDPYETIMDLQATVSAIRLNWRVVLVPLGPKVFALCCLLVAMLFDTNVSVWRLSADDQRTAEDRVASGTVVGLTVRRSATNG